MDPAADSHKDVLRGVGGSFGVLALLLAASIPLGAPSAAAGLWFVWLFVSRRLWLDPFVRVVYRGGWTRIFLWPLSTGDEESCARILRSLTWGYLFVGILLVALEVGSPLK
jgi:hypothetical protein